MDIILNLFYQGLEAIFQFTGDWGVAVVLLTIGIKLILLPLSIKQRISSRRQVELSKKVQEVKEKYKKNKRKLEQELAKLNGESLKGMMGCVVTLLQLPIISAIFMVMKKVPKGAISSLIPWAESISLPDNNFIIPLLYVLITLIPGILSSLKIIDDTISIKTLIPIAILSLIFTVKSPIAIGIYLITSSICTILEQIGFSFYQRCKRIKTN